MTGQGSDEKPSETGSKWGGKRENTQDRMRNTNRAATTRVYKKKKHVYILYMVALEATCGVDSCIPVARPGGRQKLKEDPVDHYNST